MRQAPSPFPEPPNTVVSATILDGAFTVELVFVDAVTAAHWMPTWLQNTSEGTTFDTVIQGAANSLLFFEAAGDNATGDSWALVNQADGVPPGQNGVLV